jgi:hypothetical protein
MYDSTARRMVVTAHGADVAAGHVRTGAAEADIAPGSVRAPAARAARKTLANSRLRIAINRPYCLERPGPAVLVLEGGWVWPSRPRRDGRAMCGRLG